MHLTSSYLRAWLGKNINNAKILFVKKQSILHNVYQCNCGKRLVLLSSFLLHSSRKKHAQTLNKCHICIDTKRMTSEEFKKHMLNDHKKHKEELCNICPDNGIHPSHCYQCKNTYKSHNLFLLHKKKHEVLNMFKIKKTFNDFLECVLCKEKYLSKEALFCHLEDYLNKTNCFICQFCTKTFKSKKAIKNHLQKVHMTKKPISCQRCGKLSKTRSIHKAHLNTHDPNKKFLCMLCGKKFAQAAGLCIHMKNLHKDAIYPCRFCNKFFRYILQLDSVFIFPTLIKFFV